jgi:pimeloyl-ACP methyl ester carboxylesterase
MSRNKTAGLPQDRAWVTAAEWFAGGQRIWYDPGSARVLTGEEAAATPGALRVFERVAAAGDDADAVWITLLPGFPDGSYGWAQVDRMLGDGLGSRLYAEPVGQGDSDKPRDYPYSTVERVPQAEILTFPGGHLTTSEYPDHLAAAIRDIAARHGVGTTATANR